MAGLNLVLIFSVSVAGLIGCVAVEHSQRWRVLLALSLVFYTYLMSWQVLPMLGLVGLIYGAGRVVERKNAPVLIIVLALLIPMILSNILGPSDHFGQHLSSIFSSGSTTDWISFFQLLGLSYVTFNGISYVVDIHRGYIKPEPSFLKITLYLMYFPTILAGPLHRVKYLLPQFKNIQISNENLSKGFQLVLWGFFKTSVIGERLDLLLYNFSISNISGFYCWIQGFLFFLFLYINFSAFVDISQGISQLFGIRLKDNFRSRLYLSATRKSFWQGWHITLNDWFRDYFFFVFAKTRLGKISIDLTLLITFSLIGLWHGFTLALFGWGLLSGLWIVLEKNARYETWPFPKLRSVVGVGYHLLFTAIIALLFIHSDHVQLWEKVILTPPNLPKDLLKAQLPNITIIASSIGLIDFLYAKAGSNRIDDYLSSLNSPVRWGLYFVLIVLVLLFGLRGGISNYYIQF